MKKLALTTVLMFFLMGGLFSQTGFIRYKDAGVAILNNGDSVKGTVSYELSYPGSIMVYFADGSKKKFDYNDLKEFYLGDKHYITIKIKVLGNPNTFALILNSEKSKIRLFKYEQQPIILTDDRSDVTTEYYVWVNGEEYSYGVADMKFMPFHKKMSKFVESCPQLSQKILNKEDGYKIGLISTPDMKLEVFKKVAQEFDECK